ncbi:MAG: hypothetical protein Q8N55_01225 [bacterium]|nr:hypothetical protein [bacterium]
MPEEISPLKQKILLALVTGLSIGLSYSMKRHAQILKEASREWEKINKAQLKKEINTLYRSKLVNLKENPDQTFSMTITDKGKLKVLKYHFDKMKISEKNWDGKWRLVVFDVPEKFRKGRDALRSKLKNLGFHELQKSVFVFPYHCQDEVDFIIEFFGIRPYARYGVLESIDSDQHLRKIFELTE